MTKNVCITILHVQNTTITHITNFAGDSNTYCNRKGSHAVIPSTTKRVKKALSFHTPEQTRVRTHSSPHAQFHMNVYTHACTQTKAEHRQVLYEMTHMAQSASSVNRGVLQPTTERYMTYGSINQHDHKKRKDYR